MYTFHKLLNRYFLSACCVPQGTSQHTGYINTEAPQSLKEELITYVFFEYKGQSIQRDIFKYRVVL